MGRLQQAAQSLDIGKGVSIYTITHFGENGLDLRSSNLSNNFENGVFLRIDKSKIKSTNAYVYDEKGKLEKPVIYSDFIGRLYHQNDEIESSSFNFITEEGFTNFEKAIRDTNIKDNVNDFYANIVPEDYSAYLYGEYDSSKVPQTSKIGDEYSIRKPVLHTFHGFIKENVNNYASKLMFYTRNVSAAIGADGFSSGGKYEYMGLVPTNIMDSQSETDIVTSHLKRIYKKDGLRQIFDMPNKSDIFNKYNFKDIVEVGEAIRYRYDLRNYRYNFDYFLEHIGPDQKISEGLSSRKYGDIENISELPFFMETFGKFGLYDNSEDFREGSMKEHGNIYGYNNQYAVGSETSGDESIEYFSVNEKISDFLTIITKGNKGSVNDGFYREHDEGGLPNIVGGSDKNVKNLFMPYSGETISGYSKLLQRTNSMFYNQRIGSLINRFHTSKFFDYNGNEVDIENDELITSKSKYGLSRGRNLLTEEGEKNPDKTTGYENPYCRVWTAHHQYGKINTLIRPFKGENGSISSTQSMYSETQLRPNDGGDVLASSSVLMNNGFVKITPTYDDSGSYLENDIKRCMFSIENLAWRDVHIDEELSKEQRGPNKGRIMWFPPYNLKFTENVNVDWNANKFIGRGEQIYTYANTDRSGTLSFTLLIDHPSIINKWRGRAGSLSGEEEIERENEILRFFAGCAPLEGTCGNAKDTPKDPEPDIIPNNPTYEGRTRKVALVLFFPNNFSANDYKNDTNAAIEKLKTYERGESGNVWINEEDEDIENQVIENVNKSLYNLNYIPSNSTKEQIRKTLFDDNEDIEFYSFFDPNSGYSQLNLMIQDINSSGGTIFGEEKKNIKIETIEVKGCASSHGYVSNNIKLGDRRRSFIKKVTNDNCKNIELTDFIEIGSQIIKMNDIGENRDINTLDAKIARSAYVVFNVKWDEETTTNSIVYEDGNFIVNDQNYSNVTLSDESGNPLVNLMEITVTASPITDIYECGNEYLYFANLKRDDEVAYQKIVERIRYFNPAYHSITPEGFNSRLTFLQQCTRQGPTMDLSSGNISSESSNYLKYAGNLSFGRAPYCILRIGDFFHTKICITSLSIDYDSSGGVQWDLNPEGVGVQPMYANININFNFIGGQDIAGPVERLQNAVSSNYYANASIYDKKAKRDYSVKLGK